MARSVLFPHYPNYNEQIKGPEFISSVLFAFGICCCQLSRWDPKSCHYQWSKPSLGWKTKQTHQRDSKNIRRGQTTVWNILKKKECTGELSNTKRPGRPRKTTVVDDRRILSLVKKTPFTTVGQIKNTLQEVGVCVSKSTIKRRLHQSEYRGFTTRCKPLVSLKNRKARLEFAKRHLKSLHSSGTTSYGQMRPRSTCTRVMGREEYGEGKELLMILSIPPHQWSMVVVVSWRGHVWLPVELVLLYLLMMWLLTKAAGWILKCFGQYYLLIFSQMLQNSLDGASQCRWTMTQSILQKQPKSFWRERSGLLCNGQVNHLTWIRLSMHFTCWRQNWRENAPRTSRNWRRLQ